MQDALVLSALKRAFSKVVQNGVIDLDKYLVQHESFTILRLEDLYAVNGSHVPPFRRSAFIILFVTEGTGERSIGHYNFTITDNSLAVIPKHVIHAATYTSKPYGYLVVFDADFLMQQAFSYKLLNSKRVLRPSLKPFIMVNEEKGRELTTIFEKIIEECNSGFDEKKEMIALKLLELLILCDRFFAEQDRCDCSSHYTELILQFNELIEANFRHHRDVQFYAAAMHTHPNNLNHIVKKATGLTAKHTINNRILIEAKYLLASTERSVKEIAYELGFENPNYFNTFFKKEQQSTPAHYRMQPL
jgi:AraC family transcriptional activator of pobA